MTDLSTEPVAVEAAPITPPPPPDTPPAVAKDVHEVDHTPGGWPIVPLALSGANSTIGAVAAASLAGGPIAAAVAATGMVVLGTIAATRSRKPDPRREARRSAARTASRSAARKTGQHSSGAASRRSSSGGRSAGSRSGGSGGRSGKVPGQHRRTNGGTATRHGSTTTGGKTLRKSAHGPAKHQLGSGKGAASRVGQVKALRAARKDAAGSRGGQRAQTTDARRAVADARRNAKAAGSGTGLTGRAGHKGGIAGRMLAGAAGKARGARDMAIAKNRARRDRKAGATVDAQRGAVRKAPARKAARQALRRSAARFHGRRLLAALLALPLGLLGLITSPIGRKLNLPWLIHPGRRLYRRIVGAAREQRTLRDDAIRDELAEREAAADTEAATDGAAGIADDVKRPPTTVPTSTNTPVSEGENVSGFRFEEAASEMEQAANAYDPENAMEILAMVEGLPAALTSVANVMKILAERSDSEFPLEKQIADGFNDIFGAVMSAVAVAEDMGPLFRQVHAQDIARHEDPRNGTEAEKGWNV
ncbi:hypothetical protein OHB41_22470 [Streptomyces sp. NBC_01571]|uniref:hypothetical protein n=1 Tax=Streptomyces sp. NBC_01571 TaxID=2975883 RepID=UPI00225BD090|nr:hypothetical protein [Streptomyces sp. NBC_01571]MCX4575905.1 hypothetical protein [Streptomyces sp. NBC_01571]